MFRGIKVTSIPVSNQDRAPAFYTEKLGFRLLTDQPFSDEQRIVLFQFGDDFKPGGQMNVTFPADDVEDTVRRLKGQGVTITMEPQHAEWGTAAGFQDLDGNRFILSSR
jgi:catechol 2,3-dioxygenase-like lactoylglutathione lyase family enzyme